jgi:hypothetical protein
MIRSAFRKFNELMTDQVTEAENVSRILQRARTLVQFQMMAAAVPAGGGRQKPRSQRDRGLLTSNWAVGINSSD